MSETEHTHTHDQYVTRDELRASLAEFKMEIQKSIGNLEHEIYISHSSLRNEMHKQHIDMRKDMRSSDWRIMSTIAIATIALIIRSFF